MNTPTKLGAYALGLVAVFGAATGIGSVVGNPSDTTAEPSHVDAAGHGDEDGAGHVVETQTVDTDIPGGLMVSSGGYTLALDQDALPAGDAVPLTFQVIGPGGAAVTAYDETHDKDLHLIAVRRDTTGFQHVHPVLGADGTWTTPLALTAGEWRVFADFAAAGQEPITLGTDLAVAGGYDPQPLPEPAAVAEVDGYEVTLDGRLVPGEEAELTLTVTKDGAPVTDLQPYLAAYGHLVALRDGDLAYLHVHPAGEPGDDVTEAGPDVTFYASVPSTGDYRLFLDFQHDGVVRTAEFTATAEPTPDRTIEEDR